MMKGLTLPGRLLRVPPASRHLAEWHSPRRPRGAFGLRANRLSRRPSWDRPGLERLVRAAQTDFTAATAIDLPWNLPTHGPWVGARRCGAVHDGHRAEMVGAAARMAGWLRAAPQFPLIVRLIGRTASPWGCCSPHHQIDLYAVTARFTPGGLNRWLRLVVRRADQILAAYGLRCSWAALAEVAGAGDRRPGKAALRAAAATVRQWTRRWLGYPIAVSLRGRPRDVLAAARGLRALALRPRHHTYGVHTGWHAYLSLPNAACAASSVAEVGWWASPAGDEGQGAVERLALTPGQAYHALTGGAAGLVRAALDGDEVARLALGDWLKERK